MISEGMLTSVLIEETLPLSWEEPPQENVEELLHQLICASEELEYAQKCAKMQSMLQEEKISHVQSLLEVTNKERNEAVQECMNLQRCILNLLNNDHHQAAPSPTFPMSEPLMHLNSSLQDNFDKETLLKLDIDYLVYENAKIVCKDSRDYVGTSDIINVIAVIDENGSLNSSNVQPGLNSNHTLSRQSSSASTAASDLKNIVEDDPDLDMSGHTQMFSPLPALFSHIECNDSAQEQSNASSQTVKSQWLSKLSMRRTLSESTTKSVSLSIDASASVGLECHSSPMASPLCEFSEMENKSTQTSLDKELMYMELPQTPMTYARSVSTSPSPHLSKTFPLPKKTCKLPIKRNYEEVLTSDSLDDDTVSTLLERGRLLEAVVKAGIPLHHLLVTGALPDFANPPPRSALLVSYLHFQQGHEFLSPEIALPEDVGS